MPSSPQKSRAYKEITLQQLRSFCETARLGSFSAAAAALDLSHPTVWKQVHALEREFEVQLVESHGRGCRLTEAGRLLAELARSAVDEIRGLKRNFQESLGLAETQLIVAATPRILVEDLSACIVEFERRWPRVRLTFKEMRDDEVALQVESGEADLGLAPYRGPHADGAWLVFEPCYELDIVLVTPKDHPLARRRHVRLEDLSAYPLVNSLNAQFHDTTAKALLKRLAANGAQPQRIEAYFAGTIRRYVELGFGIGLLPSSPTRQPNPRLHERSMSRYLGRCAFYLVWRKGEFQSPAARAFAETVKTTMNPPRIPGKSRRRKRK
jgi:DNA-binding transcriptional LysR family regulator